MIEKLIHKAEGVIVSSDPFQQGRRVRASDTGLDGTIVELVSKRADRDHDIFTVQMDRRGDLRSYYRRHLEAIE